MSENIDSLRPFGDVPRKLASSVKRSLLAARALVKAMRTGHEIAKQMAKVCYVVVVVSGSNISLEHIKYKVCSTSFCKWSSSLLT